MNEKIYDRIRGALYGVAVGDALGAPLEFISAEGIQKNHGRVAEMIGGGWLHVAPGETTDDTAMTIAVANGIIQDPASPIEEIGKLFIKWMKSGPKDVGATCAHAIDKVAKRKEKAYGDWMLAGYETNQEMRGRTGGNGALMRTIYPALYYANSATRHIMVEDIGKMTHWAPESCDICREYSDAVHAAIFGAHPIENVTRHYFNRNAEPTGYVVDTWSHVLMAIFNTDTFEDAVVDAVNRGGDADTIGAITGGLAGAYYGYESIPQRWIDTLDETLKKEMDQLAKLAYKANEKYYHTLFKVTL